MRPVRSSPRKPARPDRRNRLGVEKLEDRSLMAGNVTAVVTNQVLVITGDASGNGITLDYNLANDTYQVIGTTQGGSNTTVNGVDTAVAGNEQVFENVIAIRVAMNAGDDNLVFGAANSTSFAVDRGVEIDMGAGADTVAIGRNGNAAGGAAPIENEVNIGRGLIIKLGAGADTLDITNTTVGRVMTIHADVNSPRTPSQDGADTIRFPTTFTPSGGSEQIFPVIINGHATVLLGAGNDTFNGDNLTARKGLVVQDSGGTLNFDLTDSTVGGELKLLQTGGRDTSIDIDNVTASTLRVSTGNGVDTITVRDSIFSKLDLDSGDGVDLITVGATRVRRGGFINGGRDKARLTQESGNNLRGVVKIKTFSPG
jgi:hypothetical protein